MDETADALRMVLGQVKSGDFYIDAHRTIYEIMNKMAMTGKAVTLVTLNAHMSPKQSEKVGGAPYLVTLTDHQPRPAELPGLVKELRELSAKRSVRQAYTDLGPAESSGNGTYGAALDHLLARGSEYKAVKSGQGTGAEEHTFESRGEDRYVLTVPEIGTTFEIDRLRRDRAELVGELAVRTSLPGARTFGGVLSIADFNLSSARARGERAKILAEAARTQDLDWHGLLEEFVCRVLAADRTGQPAVDLRTLQRPEPDDDYKIDGIRLPRRHPTFIFGDGGAAKSYLGLYIAGSLSQLGMKVALFDWELAGLDHRDRLERLFGPIMPAVTYARCERPLVYEIDRIERITRDERIEYALFDSVAFACDGPPEAAEVAGRYFRAVRRTDIGSLHIAHVTKAEGADAKPFGSVFWHNGLRASWYVKLVEESEDGRKLRLGLFNRKTNLDRKARPLGYEIEFDERTRRTWFIKCDPSETPELAEKMYLQDRMAIALQHGAVDAKVLSDDLGAKLKTLKRTAGRYPDRFTILQDGRIALLQIVTGT